MRIIALSTFLLAGVALGATPPFDQVQARVLITRLAGPYQGTGSNGNGIWSVDPQSMQGYRLLPLVFGLRGSGIDASLAWIDDRLVLQGAAFTEIDPVTGRLLRRYKTLEGETGSWAFQGVYISQADAQRLGLRPGTYGFPICPENDGTCSVSVLFPGRDAPSLNDTDFRFLCWRSSDPTDRRLELFATLEALPNTIRTDEHRFLAYDPGRARLWTRHESILTTHDVVHRETYMTIADGRLEPEVITLEERAIPPTPYRRSVTFGLDLFRDTFLDLYEYYTDGALHLVSRPVASNTETEIASKYVPGSIVTPTSALPETYVQIVPAVGSGPGRNGTLWQSDVWLYNPSEETIGVFVRRVTDPTQGMHLPLMPHASAKIGDALATLRGGPGGDGVATDALVVAAPYIWGKQVAVFSRTFTSAPAGTYGQGVPAVPTRWGYSNHLSEFTNLLDVTTTRSEFIIDTRASGASRHNIGLVNDEDHVATIRLRYGTSGTTPPDADRQKTITVPAHAVANVNIEGLFGANVLESYPGFIWIVADTVAPVWLSMVDNKTGDGTFVPFSIFGMEGDVDYRMAIPGVAHTAGANGTYWRTDVYGKFLINIDEESGRPLMYYYPATGSCRDVQMTALRGPAGLPGVPDEQPSSLRRIFPDVVSQVPGCHDSRGSAEFRVNSWMTAYARTYTTRADGGTFGDMLPLYPSSGFTEQHFGGIEITEDQRVNLGLYNGSDGAVTQDLNLYDRDGTLTATRRITVAPHDTMQASLESFLEKPLPQGIYGLSIIPVSETGRTWAYVSLVDNRTGDPTNLW